MISFRIVINRIRRKGNDNDLKINMIISNYRMFKQRRIVKNYLTSLKKIQRNIKRYFFNKKLKKIIKIQSIIRAM